MRLTFLIHQLLGNWSQFLNESLKLAKHLSEVTQAIDHAPRPHYLTVDNADLMSERKRRDLPIGEHYQTILVVLVRFECIFQQVNLVTATLEVHVTTFPWLIKAQSYHLNAKKPLLVQGKTSETPNRAFNRMFSDEKLQR
jgi:hypothetical protein